MDLISSKAVEGFGTLCISTLLLFLGETKLVIISLKNKGVSKASSLRSGHAGAGEEVREATGPGFSWWWCVGILPPHFHHKVEKISWLYEAWSEVASQYPISEHKSSNLSGHPPWPMCFKGCLVPDLGAGSWMVMANAHSHYQWPFQAWNPILQR